MKFFKHEFGKSLLISIIPGLILPIVFFLLFGVSTSATNRDVLPPLDNAPEIIGCLGVLIFAFPGYLFFFLVVSLENSLQDNGFTIPIFDALPVSVQGTIVVISSFAVNLIFWALIVYIIRQFVNYRADDRH